VYSFNHHVNYDMFRPAMVALLADGRSYLPKHDVVYVMTKLIYNNF